MLDTSGTGTIGPNAILQLLPALDRQLGRAGRDDLLQGIAVPPPDAGMWPEAECRAAHLAVYRHLPELAPWIMAQAGTGTADYILAHRIPRRAKAVIRAMPAALGARLLIRAVHRHAWTFAGSGRFSVVTQRPLTCEIAANPLAPGGACHWHAAVLSRLFRTLVWPNVRVEATQHGDVSQFVIRPGVQNQGLLDSRL